MLKLGGWLTIQHIQGLSFNHIICNKHWIFATFHQFFSRLHMKCKFLSDGYLSFLYFICFTFTTFSSFHSFYVFIFARISVASFSVCSTVVRQSSYHLFRTEWQAVTWGFSELFIPGYLNVCIVYCIQFVFFFIIIRMSHGILLSLKYEKKLQVITSRM